MRIENQLLQKKHNPQNVWTYYKQGWVGQAQRKPQPDSGQSTKLYTHPKPDEPTMKTNPNESGSGKVPF